MSQSKVDFPYEIQDVEPNTNLQLLKYFNGERDGFVQVGPEKYFFPYKYKTEAEHYYNFQARSNDVWIVTVPRSGTTWTQELIWLVANNLNFLQAKNKLLSERFPFFEFPLFMHSELKKELLLENSDNIDKQNFIEMIDRPGYEVLSEIDFNERRFIKTHFPFSLLPPSVMQQSCKIIYVLRNPLDVAVSYYHLNRLYRTQGYRGDFERYWNYFQNGYNAWLPYYSHVKEALAHQHFPNVLFLRYEEMLNNLSCVIEKIAKFLDCHLDAEGIENLKNHLNIKNFRLNSSVNGHEMADVGILNMGEAGFVRKGAISTDGFKQEEFENEKLLQQATKWMEEEQKKKLF